MSDDESIFEEDLLSEDRRKFSRYNYEGSVYLELEAGGKMKRLPSENVSAGGLLLHLDEELKLNEQLKIFFELPHFLDFVGAICSVRHVHEEKDGFFKVGVQLEELDNIKRYQFLQFLEAYFEGK